MNGKFIYEFANWRKRHILTACRYCGLDKADFLLTKPKSEKSHVAVACASCGAKGPDVPAGATAEEIGKATSKAARLWNAHQPCAFRHCCCCGEIHIKEN